MANLYLTCLFLTNHFSLIPPHTHIHKQIYRFRSCLKVANSGAANLVGKIYFNVVKTKCFMFKMDDMCIDRTWWGNCIETKRRKRAIFREPMEY
mgnify:CR=1 FL=1